MTGSNTMYVLKLEHGKWWMNVCSNLSYLLERYFNGNGSRWAQLHPPIEVVETTPVDEVSISIRQKTLQMMKRHGWENVRGHPWNHPNLKEPPDELENVEIQSYEKQSGLGEFIE